MAQLPVQQPLMEDFSDDELTDEQVRQLLTEASERILAKGSASYADAPFKLPKLNPGHIADTYSNTNGEITKLDTSKLLSQEQRAMANGIKKIEDPVQLKRQKKEVRFVDVLSFAGDDNYPILH